MVMSDEAKDLNPFPPRNPVRAPANEDEWRAWDAYAAAALTGSLWWNRHKPIAADDPARDAALIADETLELRRKRKRTG